MPAIRRSHGILSPRGPQQSICLRPTNGEGTATVIEDGAMSEFDPGSSFRMPMHAHERTPGTISYVEGRGSAATRGLAAMHEMHLDLADGGSLGIVRFRPPSLEQRQHRAVARIPRVDFERCPICLEPDPKSEEHVPPRSMGGVVLSVTCDRCNNEFGSRFETHLLDWFEDAFHVRMGSNLVPGDRRIPRLLRRQATNGRPVLMVDRGRVDPDIARMLDSGDFSLLVAAADPRRMRVALLKSAYIAACALAGEILDTPLAAQTRELLVRMRDLPRREVVPEHALLDDLHFGRSYVEAIPEVRLTISEAADGSRDFAIELAGVVAVRWPFERIVFESRVDWLEPADG